MTFRAGNDHVSLLPVQLQSFAQQSTQIALPWTVIGLGAGGGKIADAFANIRNRNNQPVYPTLAINSYLGDLTALNHIPENHRLGLIGYENGCGHSPYKGYQALNDARNKDRVWEKINAVSASSQAIWLAASLGGGTGTGGIGELITWAAYTQKPIGAILTLPRRGNLEELGNALDALAPIYNDLLGPEPDRPLKSLIIVDNEKVYQDYLVDKAAGQVPDGMDWMTYANTKLAHILHELNVIPTGASDVNFDPEDFRKVLFSGGSVTFAKQLVRADATFGDHQLKNEVLSTVVGGNVLASGFDFETGVIAGAVCLMVPENSRVANVNSLEVVSDELKTQFPGLRACLQQGYTMWDSKNHMLIYSIMSLNTLPERGQYLKVEHEAMRTEQEALLNRRAMTRIEHTGGASAPRHVAPFAGFPANGPAVSPFSTFPANNSPFMSKPETQPMVYQPIEPPVYPTPSRPNPFAELLINKKSRMME
ncbi:hypothetical protein [Heliophilum fasciatum]|uniref:Tubulin-like protein TubZ-like C-terminal domain-containing protein n=1 Tax=Heliophilum fasciatum TaxID=35700 RepID=A0A4R2RLV0_9FIRM|nr:hypothetical protein [Heliophilum fasciatum]MCW2278253.1 cell division GTPase FtsZ [Heliophilum fasciatum]TCP63878.1 hypothetical protein EDD73_11425 [Heliophilum fasciatum]